MADLDWIVVGRVRGREGGNEREAENEEGGAVHGEMDSKNSGRPFRTTTTAAGLAALRLASMVVDPVAPRKFFVTASASRIAAPSVEPARRIASASISAASYERAAAPFGVSSE